MLYIKYAPICILLASALCAMESPGYTFMALPASFFETDGAEMNSTSAPQAANNNAIPASLSTDDENDDDNRTIVYSGDSDEDSTDSKRPKYYDPVKQFARSQEHDNHKKGIKTFKCTYNNCYFSTAYKSSLDTHLRIGKHMTFDEYSALLTAKAEKKLATEKERHAKAALRSSGQRKI